VAQQGGRVGQERRRHQGDRALEPRQQGQQQGPFAVAGIGQQDLGQCLRRQPAAGQRRIQRRVPGRQSALARPPRAAAPELGVFGEGDG
jgi:hypothetical protein